MTSFNDREKGFENKFALDAAQMFKAEARCCKLFGLWLAEKLDMVGEEAKQFAAGIVGANLEEAGFDDVKRHVMSIIEAKGGNVSEADIDAKLAEYMIEAQRQISTEG